MTTQLKCMDTIPQGVFIIGTKMNATYNFMTAAFVTQISFNPCSIAVSVASTHYTAELIREQGAFTVSVLEKEQKLEAKSCGYQSGRKIDKSKRMHYHLTSQGLPAIDGAVSCMVCRVRQIVEYEDHTVFFAEVEDGDCRDAQPMIYVSKDFFS